MKVGISKIAELMLLLLLISTNSVIPKTTGYEDETREVIVLLDVTTSFKFKEKAIEQIKALIRRLGPGDEFLLIEIGPPPFLPSKKVKIQATMPSVPEGIFAPSKNIHEWKKRQHVLSSIWNKLRIHQKSMLTFLEQPISVQRGGTDLYAALEYAAQRFETKGNRKKFLIIYSDLVQDLGVGTTDPPKKRLAGFNQAIVSILFVPWESLEAWESKKQKWRAYFETCHVQSFTMHEPAESETHVPLPSSEVPTKLKSLFSN